MELEEPQFFIDYLSYVPLSGHSDNFSKYDRKIFLYGQPTSALTPTKIPSVSKFY